MSGLTWIKAVETLVFLKINFVKVNFEEKISRWQKSKKATIMTAAHFVAFFSSPEPLAHGELL